MTTELTKSAHPRLPSPDRYTALVDRCLAEYHTEARRQARNRIIGYTLMWLGIIGGITALFYFL